MSGTLLNSVLRDLDPQFEEHVFITNTVRCRPPDNREPFPVEVKKCAPLFLETVSLVSPSIILALGNTAARMLSGLQVANISRLREESQSGLFFAGIPLRFAFHPAYIRRNYSLLGVFQKDLREALAHANVEKRAPQAEQEDGGQATAGALGCHAPGQDDPGAKPDDE
jgi:DNA polymerase